MEKIKMPGIETFIHIDHFYFGSQPEDEAYACLKSLGIKAIINLRSEDEDIDNFLTDKELALENGMEYHIIPFLKNKEICQRGFRSLSQLVSRDDLQNAELFVHCRTGNRVAGWYLIHLVKNMGASLNDTLSLVREMGISKELEDKVITYLK